MPPRYVVFVIAVLWLATTAWLFHRELWPHLRPGGPPPFVIDLADEASEQKIFWSLSQNGVDMGYAQTWVEFHRADDTFELRGLYKWFGRGRKNQEEADLVIRSAYRVTRDGELRRFHADLDAESFAISARIDGQVESGRVTPHLHATGLFPITGETKTIDLNLPAIEVPTRGAVLNPQLPVNRLQGLRPGQSWQMPLWDPLADVMASWKGDAGGLRLLQVKVLDHTEVLKRGQRVETCLVVEFEADAIQGRIWVRQSDGLVLRQEAATDHKPIVQDRD